VLAVGIATLRTIDAPATAQPAAARSQPEAQRTAGSSVASQTHGPEETAVPPTAVRPTATHPPSMHPATAHPPTGQPSTGEPSVGHPSAGRSGAAVPTVSERPGASPGRTTTGAPRSKQAASAVEVAGWVQTLRALDSERAKAFWTLDPAALDRIYVPGSPPWVSDRALLAAYREQGVRVEGLRITIESTAITRRTPTTVTLKTVDHLTAGQAIDRTGTKTSLPLGIPTTRLITLTTTARSPAPSRSSDGQRCPGWRISKVTQP
jgi:hypothetical protein